MVRRTCLALWLWACSSSPQPEGAFVRVVVATQTSSGQITRVSVTAMPANVSKELNPDGGGTFSGTLEVPAGVPQTVTASAVAGTALVGSGSGSVTVAKGVTSQLSITALDVTGPAPSPDHSPVITSLVASAISVALGDQVSLTATAMDADGDPIAFAWAAAPAGCGTFTAASSAATTWTAAAAGTCTVTVTASARGLSDSKSVDIAVSGGTGPPTPTLVQHLSSTMNPPTDGISGNDYRFTLPNAVVAGNCLVLGISYSWSATRTVRVTDSNGNGWAADPAATVTDGADLISSVFVLPNAKSGTTTITVSFDAPLLTFQYTISEFTDIDPAAPVSGKSTGRSNSPNLAVGAFTPTNNDGNGGNLIWSYFIDNAFVSDNGATAVVPGSGFTLLDADIGWTQIGISHAAQYFLQRTAAAVTPSMTATMSPGNDNYNGLAIALKAGTSGSLPASSGIRVQGISHFTNSAPPATWVFQFPTRGNLIVGVVCQSDIIDITSITDSKGNVYTRYEPETDEPQIWYAANATPDPNLKITVHSAGTPVNSSFIWYDVSGADPSPVDGAIDLTGGGIARGQNTITDAPLLTPVSAGMTIAAISFGTGPATGLASGSPPGAIFDFVTYAGETDIDRMDNADGRAHLYNTDFSPEHFNWILNHTMGTTASATAVHFKSAQ